MRYLMALALSLVLAVPAMAASPASYMKPEIFGAATTIGQLADMHSGKDVVLEGKITPTSDALGNYSLQDDTGSVALRVNDHEVNLDGLNPQSIVRLRGAVSIVGAGERLVNVNMLEIMP